MPRLIDSDEFLQDMADLYRQAGWDEREVHFSLADLRSNIGMEDVIQIPRKEADTVPVIRCKNCKWYYRGGATCMYWDGENNMCGDDYCSRAERRKDGRRQNNTV